MSIYVQQPQPYDLVGDTIHIAGIAGGAFESNFTYLISDGQESVGAPFTAGDPFGGHTQFHLAVDTTAAAFTRVHLDVELVESPGGPPDLAHATVPVLLGRLIVPDYSSFREHTVEAGDTLWALAESYYGSGDLFGRIVTANPTTIIDPDVLDPGDVLRIPVSIS